jgi:hypothetical protein
MFTTSTTTFTATTTTTTTTTKMFTLFAITISLMFISSNAFENMEITTPNNRTTLYKTENVNFAFNNNQTNEHIIKLINSNDTITDILNCTTQNCQFPIGCIEDGVYFFNIFESTNSTTFNTSDYTITTAINDNLLVSTNGSDITIHFLIVPVAFNMNVNYTNGTSEIYYYSGTQYTDIVETIGFNYTVEFIDTCGQELVPFSNKQEGNTTTTPAPTTTAPTTTAPTTPAPTTPAPTTPAPTTPAPTTPAPTTPAPTTPAPTSEATTAPEPTIPTPTTTAPTTPTRVESKSSRTTPYSSSNIIITFLLINLIM